MVSYCYNVSTAFRPHSGHLWAQPGDEVWDGVGVAGMDVVCRGSSDHGGQAQLEQQTCKGSSLVLTVHLTRDVKRTRSEFE